MKRFIPILFLAVCVSGCITGTPSAATVLTEANDSLIASETILTAADKAGLIPATDRAVIAQAVYVAQTDLTAANANSGSGATASVLAQVQADIAAVVSLRLKYAAPSATTQPAK